MSYHLLKWIHLLESSSMCPKSCWRSIVKILLVPVQQNVISKWTKNWLYSISKVQVALCLPGKKYKDLVFLRKTITYVQFDDIFNVENWKSVMCDMEKCEDCRNLNFLRCKDPSGNAGPLFACKVVEEAPSRKLPSRKRKASTATDMPVGFDKTVLVITYWFKLTMLSAALNADGEVALGTKSLEPRKEITLHLKNVIHVPICYKHFDDYFPNVKRLWRMAGNALLKVYFSQHNSQMLLKILILPTCIVSPPKIWSVKVPWRW